MPCTLYEKITLKVISISKTRISNIIKFINKVFSLQPVINTIVPQIKEKYD